MSLRDIVLARKKANEQFAKYRDVRKGILTNVDVADSTKVTSRPGYNWVKEHGQDGGVFQCFNTGVQDRVGLPVLIGLEPKEPFRRIILSLDWGMVPFIINPGDDDPGDYDLKPHAASHEWPDNAPGPDVVQIYSRAIIPLRAQWSSGVIVYVHPGVYWVSGTLKRFNGQFVDLASYIPSTVNCKKRVLLYINSSANRARVQDQDEVCFIGEIPLYDSIQGSGNVPIAWVYLEQGDTTLADDDITDARPLFTDSFGVDQLLEDGTINELMLSIEHHLEIEMTRHFVEG